MARILFTSELGGNLGHWANICPFARLLAAQGHTVFAALHDPAIARHGAQDEQAISFVPVPFAAPVAPDTAGPPRSFARVLNNSGYRDANTLRQLVAAWKDLYQRVQPELLVAEYSPTALLAAWGEPMRKVVMGSGFCNPPDVSPPPDLRPWLPPDHQAIQRETTDLLARMNSVLDNHRAPPLKCITQLFSAVDDNFLLTFEELDHYGRRPGTEYWGSWQLPCPQMPSWPASGRRLRVFGYLRGHRETCLILECLQRADAEVLLFAPDLDEPSRQAFRSEAIHFSSIPVSLPAAAQDCHLAVLNGSAAATANFLLAGKPVFMIPLHLEQRLMARRVEQLGAGPHCLPDQPDEIGRKLADVCESENYHQAARAFAERYERFSAEASIDQIHRRIGRLLRL